MTISSIFLLPDSTTSSSAFTTNFNPSSLVRLSLQYFSRNSLTCLELRPQDCAFHSEKDPEGSVQQRWGREAVSKPAMRELMPKGLTPPFWVYFCFVYAMNREIYSTGGESSQLRRQLWHQIRALLAKILPSAVRPEYAIWIWLSSCTIFFTVLPSWSLVTAFF